MEQTSAALMYSNIRGIGQAHRLTLQSDFVDPLHDGKAKIEGGIKATLHVNHSFNDFQDYSATTQMYVQGHGCKL